MEWSGVEMENKSQKYTVDLGIYDIPIKQQQPPFKVDLLKSHIALFGMSMSGKTNFLKLLINLLHQKCSTDEEQIFILDFGGAMQAYKNMPLVSAYFSNANEEYVKRVFKILETILKDNTHELGSRNFSEVADRKFPHTTFIIDNLNAFIDETRYSSYQEKFGRICRDGCSRGITVVFTASDTKGVSKYLLSFEQKIALNIAQDKCFEIFGVKTDSIGNIPGRGFANVTVRPDEIKGTFDMNYPYEVQCCMHSDIEEQDSEFVRLLNQKFAFDTKKGYQKQVKKYRTFPENLERADFDELKQPLSEKDKKPSEFAVNVGLDYVDFKPVSADFKDDKVIGIYGKKGYGKTNLLKILLDGISRKVSKDTRFIFLDDGRDALDKLYNKYKGQFDCEIISKFKNCTLVLADGSKIERKLSPMLQFYRLIHEEYMSLKEEYDICGQIYGRDIDYDNIPEGKSISDAPATVFVIQSKSVYLNSKFNSDFVHYILPELVDVAEERNFIFLFTDVKNITEGEVSSVFNSTLKVVFLLDNIAEFAAERGKKSVFGDMDIKDLKEDYAKCELGDGYYYDIDSDLLKKCKFIKFD